MAKPSFPMPTWKLKVGEEIVTIDGVQRYYLFWLAKGPYTYEFLKTGSNDIENLIRLKLARFRPGKYPSLLKRIVEITKLGEGIANALDKHDAIRREKAIAGKKQ